MAGGPVPVQDPPRRRVPLWALLLTGGVALAVVAALVVTAVVLRNGSDENLQVVEYEQPGDVGEDPFTTTADVEGSSVVHFTPTSGSTGSGNSEPFGGSGSLHVCDREKLVDFLLSHPSQRRAWARVLGIDDDRDSVSRYIRSLTPVTLTVDTRVTNHMYVNGRAVPFQSILAAGTAVLIDKYGRPVVRCKCGNPLRPPVYYPRTHCRHCPPHYKPPKWCKWRIYDPWWPYPIDQLPPEYRDPYPKNYPKPKPWVYKKGKYCYIVYPDPPEVKYPPLWYPPDETYTPPPTYQPRPGPTYTYTPPDDECYDNFCEPPPEDACKGHKCDEEPQQDPEHQDDPGNEHQPNP